MQELVRIWKKLQRSLESETALHDAAWGGASLQRLHALIEMGFDLNALDRGKTPLGYSLSGEHYRAAIFLLSKGADPNVLLLDEKSSTKYKAVQPYLNITIEPNYKEIDISWLKQRNKSIILLLTAYGTTKDDVNFQKNIYNAANADLKEFFVRAEEYYRKRVVLEQKLKYLPLELDENQLKAAGETCTALAAVWSKLLQEEEKNPSTFDNSAFKEHYKEKVRYYTELAEEFRLGQHKGHSTSTDIREEEKQPLLKNTSCSTAPSMKLKAL